MAREFGIDLAAEHGVWLKDSKDWRRTPGLSSDWKNDVRAALDNIVERTPGSFIEEKEFSIAWHYRQIDKDLGEKRLKRVQRRTSISNGKYRVTRAGRQ